MEQTASDLATTGIDFLQGEREKGNRANVVLLYVGHIVQLVAHDREEVGAEQSPTNCTAQESN